MRRVPRTLLVRRGALADLAKLLGGWLILRDANEHLLSAEAGVIVGEFRAETLAEMFVRLSHPRGLYRTRLLYAGRETLLLSGPDA